jgi:cytochrome bd-type quinol oxidase subunit 2
MKIFKKIGSWYFALGLGTIFGAVISGVVTNAVYHLSGESVEAFKILQIEECLKERLEDLESSE